MWKVLESKDVTESLKKLPKNIRFRLSNMEGLQTFAIFRGLEMKSSKEICVNVDLLG
jgi:mRNA-degrading endonuclease RelE of RelBE toxin-antitoxin system